jgi:hypothetical protein
MDEDCRCHECDARKRRTYTAKSQVLKEENAFKADYCIEQGDVREDLHRQLAAEKRGKEAVMAENRRLNELMLRHEVDGENARRAAEIAWTQGAMALWNDIICKAEVLDIYLAKNPYKKDAT